MKKTVLTLALALSCISSFAQGLVAHWNFNGNYNDAGPNFLSTTPLSTGMTYGTGQAGAANTALYFNGSSDGLNVAYHPALNLQHFTIQAVVQPQGWYAGPCQNSAIIWHDGDMSSSHYSMRITDNSSCDTLTPLYARFGGHAAGIGAVASSTQVMLNTWYCLTLTYDGSDVKIYVNGNLEGIQAVPNPPTLSNSGLSIGYDLADMPSFPYWFNGLIDDIKIWDYAFDTTQIDSGCAAIANPCGITDVSYCTSINNPLTVTFTPSVSPSTGLISWDFGDGTTTTPLPAYPPVSHTYGAPGSYQVCGKLWVDDQLCSYRCFNICVAEKVKGSDSFLSNQSRKAAVIPATEKRILPEPFPNPAKTVLYVPVDATTGKATVTILSMEGVVLQAKALTKEDNLAEMPISNLSPGNYIVQIVDATGKRTRTFTKL